MMDRIQFVLALHSHQPVGNFDHVFHHAHEVCYKPFLQVFKAHPSIKFALHFSGPLYEYYEAHAPGYLDDLRAMVESGQVEILGGGFYEPILGSLPVRDARRQIEMMRDFCRRRLGTDPEGIWLTERVWDPDLPRTVVPAGVRYTLADDNHFLYAGLSIAELEAPLITEREGYPLALFPLDRKMRYLIPFHDPLDVVQRLRVLQAAGYRNVTYGDDCEKFGIWPGTAEWVYKKRWLHQFLEALEGAEDWVEMAHFRDVMASHPSGSRVYLPTASYEEMMEWSLPAETARKYVALRSDFDKRGRLEVLRPFLRGGIWHNFLAKYPESNQLHKRMLMVSQYLEDARKKGIGEPELERAQQALFRGQCNDAYWHGLFGGLYLPHLRHGLYQNLLEAERLLDEVTDAAALKVRRFDFDADGADELFLSTPELALVVSPERGGALTELDYRPAVFNVTNVLTRRKEHYHHLIKSADFSGTEAPKSIHDQVIAKEKGLQDHLCDDLYRRESLLDHFLARDTTPEKLSRLKHTELGDFISAPYEASLVERPDDVLINLKRTGLACHLPVSISKDIALSRKAAELHVAYRITNEADEAIPALFAVELNFNFLSGDDPMRYYRLPQGKVRLGNLGSCQVDRFSLVNEYDQLEISVEVSQSVSLLYFPLLTVSQSESGFEKIFQGSCLNLIWPGEIGAKAIMEPALDIAIRKR